MSQPTASAYRMRFFGGVIGLNVLLFFRHSAMNSDWTPYLIWAGTAVGIGAFMLHALYHMRRLRLSAEEIHELGEKYRAKQQRREARQQRKLKKRRR